MELFIILLALLVAGRIFGEVAVRAGQPSLVGELIAGILIGAVVHYYPETFPAFVGLAESEVFRAVTDLGVFFLMLLAGIEMQPHKLTEKSGGTFLIALSGMLVPLLLGFGLLWFLVPDSPYRLAQALFLGTALAITAVPVAVKILMDLGRLESRLGQIIVGAAIFDDVLSLILLSALTALIQTGDFMSLFDLATLVGKIVLFFAITTAIGIFVLPRLEPMVRRLLTKEVEFNLLVLVALAFAVLAEMLDMHFIIGAFVAGLFFSRRALSAEIYEDVKRKVSALTLGFLAPLFFVSIGLRLEITALTAVPLFVIGLIVLAVAGKICGAALPAMAVGISRRDSLAIGVAMSARGAVELIIAEIALRAGLFSHPEPRPLIIEHMFSAVVIMAIVTTILAPIGLRLLIPADEKETDEAEA